MRASLWILSIWCWHDRHKTFLYFIARDVVVRGCTAQVHWLCHRRLVLILSNSQMLPFFIIFRHFLSVSPRLFSTFFFLTRFFHHNDSRSCLRSRRHHHHLFTFTIYWLYWIRLVCSNHFGYLTFVQVIMLCSFQCALYSYSRLCFSFFCSHFFLLFTSLFLSQSSLIRTLVMFYTLCECSSYAVRF